MKLKLLFILFTSLVTCALASFTVTSKGSLNDPNISLIVSRNDKQEIRTLGIQGQEILVKVKTKEWERKQDTTTEIWLTAWSTFEGKTVKSKFHRFLGDADKCDVPLTFRHFDKRNGVKEIKINFQIELKNIKHADQK